MIVYVAYGRKAIHEVSLSIKSLGDRPITVICQEPLDIPGINYVLFEDKSYGARWAKLNVNKLVTNKIIGYLDADTRVHENIEPAFEMIEAGWDMAMSYSINQGSDVLKHIDEREREVTLVHNPFPLQFQCGVMFFHRKRCEEFFDHWRYEWLRYKEKDQGAFIRALNECPLRIALLGRPWNGGSVVEHLFGRAHGVTERTL